MRGSDGGLPGRSDWQRRLISSSHFEIHPPSVAFVADGMFLPHPVLKQHLRERILTEWRGLPQREPSPDRMKSIQQCLDQALARLGLSERMGEAEILNGWKDLVGEFLASHSVPVSLKNGCLQVRVTQPTIRYELETVWKAKLLANLQTRFGKKKIQSIRFQL